MAKRTTSKSPTKRKPIQEKKVVSVPTHDEKLLIPTGSTMFNLACSNNGFGGYKFGKIVNLIGDSHAGKSIAAMTMLACCVYNKRFDDYKLILDDVEEADEFDHTYMFGNKFGKRIEAPRYVKGVPDNSGNIEDWQDNLHRLLDNKEPFIYVTDSFDALHSEEDEKKAIQQYEDRQKGKEAKGTYGMGKAKSASFVLRRIRKRLKQTNSFVLIISQTRDNISPSSFAPKTRSGGRALKFYSTHEIWGAVKQKISKTSGGKKEEIGAYTKWKVTKNKLTGRNREVEFPIYSDIGIDDIASCIDYLQAMKVVTKGSKLALKLPKRNKIVGTKDKLIKTIEENDLESELSLLCQDTWMEFENKLRLKGRKRRFK